MYTHDSWICPSFTLQHLNPKIHLRGPAALELLGIREGKTPLSF